MIYIQESFIDFICYWRMERHALQQLISDFTCSLAFSGLELETQVHFYLKHKAVEPLPIFQKQQTELQAQAQRKLGQDCSGNWSVKQYSLLTELMKNELARKGTEAMYIEMYAQRAKQLNLQLSFSQTKRSAIQQFSNLETNQQLRFLAYYLRETSDSQNYSSSSLWKMQSGEFNFLGIRDSKFFENGFYFGGLSGSSLPQFNRNGGNTPYFQRQLSKSAQNQAFWLQNRGIEGIQHSSADSKNKSDIYKMALGKGERQQQKGEQSKEKTQFQTLKSLFKKLQNNS